VFLQWTKAKR